MLLMLMLALGPLFQMQHGTPSQGTVELALVAEALAVKAAMTAAISSHVNSLLVRSDSKTLISLLKFHGQDVVLKDLRLLSNKLRHKLGGVSGSRPWMVRRSHVEGGGSLRFQVLEDGGGFLLPQKSS
ncbi:hypothetical protein DY000_02020046 [Brassica cretica]|uniref:RNase H type-1 domain-containing protein n=1 Tax=Brassica cretica TaxID=69181 RepID=A0ABQ7EAY7_BRACR|nr:hypothetical protein DY000_02020046 [Brassica cretica]